MDVFMGGVRGSCGGIGAVISIANTLVGLFTDRCAGEMNFIRWLLKWDRGCAFTSRFAGEMNLAVRGDGGLGAGCQPLGVEFLF